MKKKFLLTILTAVMCLVSLFAFAGCAQPLTMPNSLGVTSNGGAVVRVGDYIYFANGFIDVSDLSRGDNRSGITQGALYRAKTGANGTINYDASGNPVGAEKVVDSIVGFSSQNLFVYDSYIYFATPLNLANQQGEAQFGRTVIKRAKLDGTDVKDIYTTTSNKPVEWSVYKLEGKIVVGVLDDTTLVSINVTHNVTNSKLVENVNSLTFPSVTEYNPNSQSESANVGESVVYYTRGAKTGETNTNKIYSISLLKQQEKEVLTENSSSTLAVKQFISHSQIGSLIYTKGTNYWGVELDSTGAVYETRAKQYTYAEYEQTFIAYNSTGVIGAVVAQSSGSGDSATKTIKLCKGLGNTSTITSESLTLLAVRGTDIFAYNTDKQIVKLSASDTNIAKDDIKIVASFEKQKDEDDNDIEDGAQKIYTAGYETDKLNISLFVDFDGDYIYFFRVFTAKSGTDAPEYVYLAKANHASTDKSASLVGVMEEEHIYKAEKSED